MTSRKTLALRQSVAMGLALLATLFVIGALHCSCAAAPPLTAEENDALQKGLAECRQEAREQRDAGKTSATSYMKYEDCKRRNGVAQ